MRDKTGWIDRKAGWISDAEAQGTGDLVSGIEGCSAVRTGG